MKALPELATRLVSAGVGVRSASSTTASIFCDSLPEWAGISIVLAQASGGSGWRTYGASVADVEQLRVEMLVRSTQPVGGAVPHPGASKAKAMAAYRSLSGVANTTLTASSSTSASTWQSVMAPNGPPWLMDRDQQGRLYWRCLFDCARSST